METLAEVIEKANKYAEKHNTTEYEHEITIKFYQQPEEEVSDEEIYLSNYDIDYQIENGLYNVIITIFNYSIIQYIW